MIITRFGVVLSPEGGAFLQLIRPLQSRLATVIGSGNQPFTWIALTDLIGAMGFVIDQPGWSGVFNFVTPEQSGPDGADAVKTVVLAAAGVAVCGAVGAAAAGVFKKKK